MKPHMEEKLLTVTIRPSGLNFHKCYINISLQKPLAFFFIYVLLVLACVNCLVTIETVTYQKQRININLRLGFSVQRQTLLALPFFCYVNKAMSIECTKFPTWLIRVK